jgi:hypothetical protein
MNLRKTITGAAVALGSTAVMLGLGGTATAAPEAGAQARPDLDAELGKVGTFGDLGAIDTNDPKGKIQLLNAEQPTTTALVENLESQGVASLLGYKSNEEPSNLQLGADLGQSRN